MLDTVKENVNINFYLGGRKRQNKSANLNSKIIEHSKWNNMTISHEEGLCLRFSKYLSSQVSRKQILDCSIKVTIKVS